MYIYTGQPALASCVKAGTVLQSSNERDFFSVHNKDQTKVIKGYGCE